jgi:hypothetical protein
VDNVQRQRAAERRGWLFEIAGPAHHGGAAPPEGERIFAAQATLTTLPDGDPHRGEQFIGEGNDPLGELLDKTEAFDREHDRL